MYQCPIKMSLPVASISSDRIITPPNTFLKGMMDERQLKLADNNKLSKSACRNPSRFPGFRRGGGSPKEVIWGAVIRDILHDNGGALNVLVHS